MDSENHQPFDGYIRVSDTAGREGDSFLSPKIQRETIDRLAAVNRLTLDEVVDEMDVSGGNKVRGRKLGRLVEKVESGESGGLIVWKLSRFSRTMLDSIETVMRITGAGGRLLASDFDSEQAMGKALLGLLSGLAEEELDARREGWRIAKVNAVGRGIHISANVPFGYKRGRGPVNPRTGKPTPAPLEVDPETSWAVPELFQRRAAGESWGDIRKWLVDNNLPSVRGAEWAVSTLQGLVKNRVYLGEARGAGGGHITVNAHPPLVDEATWHAVQGRRGTRRTVGARNTSLVRGLVRCGGCRYVMQSRVPSAAVVSAFFCSTRNGCPNPASITALGLHGRLALEDVVVELVRKKEQELHDRLVLQGFDPTLEVEADEQELAGLRLAVERDRLDDELQVALGRPEWLKHLADLTKRVNEKQVEIEEKLRQIGTPAGRPSAEFWEVWDSGEMSDDEKRAHIASMIQAIFVNPDNSRGAPRHGDELRRRWFANRIEIVWATDPPLIDIPRQGYADYRITPWPFSNASNSDPDKSRLAPLLPVEKRTGEAVD